MISPASASGWSIIENVRVRSITSSRALGNVAASRWPSSIGKNPSSRDHAISAGLVNRCRRSPAFTVVCRLSDAVRRRRSARTSEFVSADIASEPEVRQLVLLDAPSVLGWAGFREISLRYGLGLTEQLLTAAIEAGQLKRQPVRPLATVMIGALDEAAMSIANADDTATEREEVRAVVHDLIDGLTTPT